MSLHSNKIDKIPCSGTADIPVMPLNEDRDPSWRNAPLAVDAGSVDHGENLDGCHKHWLLVGSQLPLMQVMQASA